MPTIPTISRRTFLGAAAGAGLAVAKLTAQAPQVAPPAGGPAPDLMLVNGRIHTMDARNTVASMVTIRNGAVQQSRKPSQRDTHVAAILQSDAQALRTDFDILD